MDPTQETTCYEHFCAQTFVVMTKVAKHKSPIFLYSFDTKNSVAMSSSTMLIIHLNNNVFSKL